MQDNLGGDLTSLSSKFEGVQLAIYEKFEPALREGVEALSGLLDALGWVVDHGTEVVATIAGIATAVGTYVAYTTALKVMEKGWKSLTIVTKLQAAAQAILNAVMAANPIGLVVAAIAGLVAAFVVLWKKSEAFRNFWIGLWEKIKEVAGAAWEAISGFFSAAWEKVQEIWGGISEFFANAWETIKSVFSGIADWINTNVFQPIVEFFQPVITFFTEAWAIISELAKGCWEAIKIIWGIVSDWVNDNVITPVKSFFTNLWDGIKEAASSAWDAIKSVWNEVSGWFKDTIISPISDFFTNMWDKLKSGASNAWEGIKSVFSPIADWFKDVFSKAWKKVKDVFSTGGKIFDGIKDGIVSAFKSVVNAIIRGINKVIAIPFNAINDILDKIKNVSIAGFTPFENLISRLTVPEIPELAKGGVVRRATNAIIGEDGAEAVIPLERNTEWLDRLAEMIAAKGGGNTYTFNQTNNSPKALSRWEIYRQTRNLMNSIKAV